MNDRIGIGVEVVFRIGETTVGVGTITAEQKPRANGPQPETVFRVNDRAGKNVGWFTAEELSRHHRGSPEWLTEPSLTNEEGELESPAEAVAQMQSDGVDQKLIDRWLQGIETRRSI